MSLLDDVSIVVTPNGYKAGELYAVIPVPTEGAELLTNENFANGDTGWSKGGTTSFSNSQVTITGASYIVQSNLLTIGKNYKLTINVDSINTNSGTVIVALGSGSDPAKQSLDQAGNLTFYFYDITFGSNWIQIFTTSDATVTVNSISVKEYTSADMDVTRATAATRVDENGLVNYAEVVTGSDIVTNGDFSNGSTDWTLQNGWALGSNDVVFTPSVSSYRKLFQENFLTIGKVYKLSFEIKSISAGSIANKEPDSPSFSTIGVKTQTYVATLDDLYLEPTNDANLTIDNISVKEVTRDNVPRIDYTGGGCPHILAEPQRTNLIPYSEDFSASAGWQIDSSVTLSLNTSIAPDGVLSADNINYAGSLGSPNGKQLQRSLTIAGGTANKDLTNSIYVKGVGKFRIKNTHGGVVDNFTSNLTATNDWVRYDFSVSNSSAAGNGTQVIAILAATTDDAFNLDIWGAQLEEGSYATSYIPTSGGTVTRNQDIFTRDGIGSLINSEEGVLFVEMAALDNNLSSNKIISLSDGTTSNRLLIYYTNIDNTIKWFSQVGGSIQVDEGVVLSDITQFSKIAFKYKLNDYSLWVDGVEVGSYTSASSFPADTLNSLALDDGGGASKFFGKVKQLQVYDTALTDEQIIQISK